MRLVVKQGDRDVNEFQFTRGPIYIGRHANSQIFLPDKAISRQHAVIFNTQDGKWVVEDLDSANKTYLNDEQIHKADIKTGDIVRISDFTIEIDLEDRRTIDKPVAMDDTITKTTSDQQIISRELDTKDAPPIRFPAGRAKDFMEATELISKASSIDELLLTLLDITAKQFDAANVWCALREQAGGPMTAHAGKNRSGQAVQLGEIKLNDKITQSVDKNKFLLFVFSRIPSQAKKGDIRSAVISPIVGPGGCFGVSYIDNAIGDDHYLMLLGIHTTTVLTRL
jgi:pSer/pThr/pTyr-binding forkhead associated (FHA) protein